MADNGNPYTEEEKAALSKKRGQAAAYINDPEQKQKFIAAQGEAEKKNKGAISVSDYSHLEKEADDTTATQGDNKNIGGKIGSYKKGTDYVPKTGLAKLHKGEAVLKKADADKYRDALSELAGADGTGAKKAPKVLKEMRIRKAANGGHIVEHHHTNSMDHPMEEHTTANMEELMGHMQEHMPDAAE